MALRDEFLGRYSSAVVIAASNPQDPTQTARDDTRINYAVSDVEAEFSKRGMTYSNANAKHVATAVPGVFARLLQITGQDSGGEAWTAFRADLEFLAGTDSRNRISPSSDSLLLPTPDTSGDLPASDRKNFDGYIPNAPNQPTTND